MLRHPMAKSSLEEMKEGTEFKPLLSFFNQDLNKKKNLIFCSGKVHYDITEFLEKNKEIKEKCALFAIEELFPFPETLITQTLNGVDKDAQAIWVQDEPLNSGGFLFAVPRLFRVLKNVGLKNGIKYCGRRALACPAIGYSDGHKRENKEIMDYLMTLCK